MAKESTGPKSNQQPPNLYPTPIHELLAGLGIKTSANKLQSHKLTVAEMEELRSKKQNGEKLPTIKANLDPRFNIPTHEQHLVWVLLEKEEWEKGKKLSKPFTQCFDPARFDIMSETTAPAGSNRRPQNAFGGYDRVKVIHDPRRSDAVTEEPVETPEKNITDMTLEELQDKYQSITGNEADADDDAMALIAKIGDLQS